MTLALEDRKVPVVPIINAVAGFGNPTSLTALSNGYSMQWPMDLNTYSNANSAVFAADYLMAGLVVGIGAYDANFVTDVLQADTAPAEAGFTNVVDMLGWLNRD